MNDLNLSFKKVLCNLNKRDSTFFLKNFLVKSKNETKKI